METIFLQFMNMKFDHLKIGDPSNLFMVFGVGHMRVLIIFPTRFAYKLKGK